MSADKSVFQQGVTSNVDVEKRVVEFVQRHALMIEPTRIVVPFLGLKAIVGEILKLEAQQEAGGGLNMKHVAGNPGEGRT